MRNPSTPHDWSGSRAGPDGRYAEGIGHQPFHNFSSLGKPSVDENEEYYKDRPAYPLQPPAALYEYNAEVPCPLPYRSATAWRANDADHIRRADSPVDSILSLAGMLAGMAISNTQKATSSLQRTAFMHPALPSQKSNTQLHPQFLSPVQAITIEIDGQCSWEAPDLGGGKECCYLLVEFTAMGLGGIISIVDLVVTVYSTMDSGTADTSEATTLSIADSGGPRTAEKRKREDDKDEDDADREGESRLETTKKRSRDGTKGAGFACPFFKKDAVRFRICCNFTAKKISHVKQHLNRVHFRPTCFRCHVVFSNVDQLNRHLMEAVACDVRVVTEFDWITVAQRDTLSHRSNPRSTEEEQWFFIFDVNFPGRPRPRSPYVEAGLSTEMSAFADFIRDRMAHRLHERISANPDTFNDNLFLETLDIIGTIIAEFTARWETDFRGSNATTSISSSRSANTLSTVMPSEKIAQKTEDVWVTTEQTTTPQPTSPTKNNPSQGESAATQSKLDESATTASAEPERIDRSAKLERSNSDSHLIVKPVSTSNPSPDTMPIHPNHGAADRPLKFEGSFETSPKDTTTMSTRSGSEPAGYSRPSGDGSPVTGDVMETDALRNEPFCHESGCNARFKTKKDLARHANSKHQKSVVYPCPH